MLVLVGWDLLIVILSMVGTGRLVLVDGVEIQIYLIFVLIKILFEYIWLVDML